ncbi:agmatine deiminase family protein [Candidatus Woesearchaeota archaeon]|nr:agmatine deiminase family protein [Candidatus Woesearchaeota archaeon]
MIQTPQELGFRMPAEWEEQEAVWLAWPHNEETWPSMLADAESAYLQFIKELHTGQKIKLLVNNLEVQKRVMELCRKQVIDITQIIFFRIPTVDAWIRDYGPTFVVGKNNEKAMVKWTFNAWGNKYDDLKQDNIIPFPMNQHLKLQMFEPRIVLEGGSIEVNGTGTVLTTEQCLLNRNRNPHLTKRQIEQYLCQYLGVKNVLWIKDGIAGDDTDGHVDDIARFVNQHTVICAFEESMDDENFKVLKENYELLQKMKAEDGKPLQIIKLPMPGHIGDDEGRLPASYTNFYIGNKAVVVPVFGSKNDSKALKILQECFPKRKVVGINSTALVYGMGTLHCLSQQEPR